MLILPLVVSKNRYIDLAEAKGEALVNENILKRNLLKGELATSWKQVSFQR